MTNIMTKNKGNSICERIDVHNQTEAHDFKVT